MKNFFALVIAFACLLTFNITTAQDVWISTNGNGSAWYIIDETIVGDANGEFKWANVDTKLVSKDGSFQTVSWKFTQVNSDGNRLEHWVYDIDYGDGKRYTEDVLTGTNAEKILCYCLNYLGM